MKKAAEEDELTDLQAVFHINGRLASLAITPSSRSLRPIITNDGRLYEDIKVVFYDGYRDIAALRVEKPLWTAVGRNFT